MPLITIQNEFDSFTFNNNSFKIHSSLSVVLKITPSIPKKSDLLIRSSFLIRFVELRRFSGSISSLGGGGGFSFGGLIAFAGPIGKGVCEIISSEFVKILGTICK